MIKFIPLCLFVHITHIVDNLLQVYIFLTEKNVKSDFSVEMGYFLSNDFYI